MNQAKRVAGGIDLALAQKIAGRGSTRRRDDRMERRHQYQFRGDTVWRSPRAKIFQTRCSTARAADALLASCWRRRETPVERSQFADQAAAQGVLSNLALVDLTA